MSEILIPEGAIRAAADWWARELADPDALGALKEPGERLVEVRRRVALDAVKGDPSPAEVFRQVLPEFIATAVAGPLAVKDGGLARDVNGGREVFLLSTDYEPMPLLVRALALAGIRAPYPLPFKVRMLIGQDSVVVQDGGDPEIIWSAPDANGSLAAATAEVGPA